MKNIVKRIAAMGAAVMMMSSMAIGASAYSAAKYGRATGGSGSNAYISCYVTGSRANSTVAGQAWSEHPAITIMCTILIVHTQAIFMQVFLLVGMVAAHHLHLAEK